MAGKSNRGRNRRGAHGNTSSAAAAASRGQPSAPSASESVISSEPNVIDSNGAESRVETSESENSASSSQANQGDTHLYPVAVKAPNGERLELQLSPADSVMDIRQFLLDAPETCFYTCYDLFLHMKDGLTHYLEDYSEISEVADITAGDCTLEMVPVLYDERSIRVHVRRTRDLLSLLTHHASLSTSLALQHEIVQKKGSDGRGASKFEVPELDSLSVMEDATTSLGNLLLSPSKEIKCLESIVFSSFNPPPSYRRLVGDLIYLDVVTLEGNTYCITGTTRNFFVNSSSANVLDPRPGNAASEATTIVGLLQKISSKFKKAFREVLEVKASSHPFENVQSLLPPNSWVGQYPIPDHKRDAVRAEDALTLSYGSEIIGMQRDWNEELQSCREFPHTTPHERILRDRALYRVTSDFVDAAVGGAMGIINRCIPPINPTDLESYHMYVHNNIFFSFAIDADVEQLSKKHVAVSTEDNASSRSTNKSSVVSAADSSNTINGNGKGKEIQGSNIGESSGSVDAEPDISAETQLADSEQATYASANNDLKGTKTYQGADIPGLHNLAMAIIDYKGHRVVAQSVLPGILQGDKSESILYGSVDNGKKISWNEDFHSKVLEAAKKLHLKEHSVLDGSGNVFKLAAPVECKGIVGSDDRKYLLDLMRVTPRDANYTGPGSRFCILRPELVAAYCQAQGAEKSRSKSDVDANITTSSSEVVDENVNTDTDADRTENFDEAAPVDEQGRAEKVANTDGNMDVETQVELSGKECNQELPSHASPAPAKISGSNEILFNPNVFTEFKLAGSEEEIAEDEENVREISSYLTETVLPKFIQDLCTLEVSPMDGQTLTEALHAHGINVRYIGKVADGTRHLPHLWDLCSNEIVIRSAKHVFKDTLRDIEDHDLGPSISNFFNCLFGNVQAVGSKGSNNMQSRILKKDQAGPSSKFPRVQSRWKNRNSAKKNLSSNRNFSSDSIWFDIQEFAELKYKFDLPEDARSRVKKFAVIRNFCQKVGISLAARRYDLDASAPFQTSDILNIQPVVKHSIPVCSAAKDLIELGKVQLAEKYISFHGIFIHDHGCSGAQRLRPYLAMVLYHAGDMAGAVTQQHKELIINERCLGLDHPDTAHSYGNMALFYHGLNQTELALRHMSRSLLLLSLSSGSEHPDVAATFINVAMMYQDMGKMDTALRYLQEALKKNQRLLGEDHIQTGVCYHALAIAFNCMGAFKLSHQHEKKTYDILVKQLGEEDSRTQDSRNWMNTFKKQKGLALNAASTQRAIDLLKAAAAAGGSGNSSASINPILRGRGVDERAARAAAEVRKKAAAKGITIRQNGVPVHLQPLSQLLNVINSSATPEAAAGSSSGVVDASKKEANGYTPATTNGGEPKKEEQATSQQVVQPPVGLGQGLASLDSKKQKSRGKAIVY
ncbi:hypothetical protein SAY86_030274 [Trapa natans]|uniref:Clu domain-containing protein n=1 Tax=Trapa natans TaxID=22666 RepID=A0AAN7MR27_TRANT|nr:hypothetical protein SAY86_030274 [Trapa natans]